MKNKFVWMFMIITVFFFGIHVNAADYELIQENEKKSEKLVKSNTEYCYEFNVDSESNVLFQLEASNGKWNFQIKDIENGDVVYSMNKVINIENTIDEFDVKLNSGKYLITLMSDKTNASYSLKYQTYQKGFINNENKISYYDKDGRVFGFKYIDDEQLSFWILLF